MPSTQGSSNNQHILEMLNFVPIEEKNGCRSSDSANQVVPSHENGLTKSMNTAKPKTSNSSTPVPDVVIIVNTQSFNKKMLISRRSSYQKILVMEKVGAQVIERDINLPLDLIFSAAVCVVWYEARNFADNQETAEGLSSIPNFMENIATSILMSLSFAFSGCIMVTSFSISLKAFIDDKHKLFVQDFLEVVFMPLAPNMVIEVLWSALLIDIRLQFDLSCE